MRMQGAMRRRAVVLLLLRSTSSFAQCPSACMERNWSECALPECGPKCCRYWKARHTATGGSRVAANVGQLPRPEGRPAGLEIRSAAEARSLPWVHPLCQICAPLWTPETTTRQLDLLERTSRALSNASIDFALAHGSALGAVRHGGFTPWDNDVDLIVQASGELLQDKLKWAVRWLNVDDAIIQTQLKYAGKYPPPPPPWHNRLARTSSQTRIEAVLCGITPTTERTYRYMYMLSKPWGSKRRPSMPFNLPFKIFFCADGVPFLDLKSTVHTATVAWPYVELWPRLG